MMPRYSKLPSKFCPLSLSRKLLNSLEGLHNTGRVHNDIKPENIMVDEKCQTSLIDFGMVEKFSDKPQKADDFLGNLMFASQSKLAFNKTTRKDDLISLAYLLIYHSNGCSLPFVERWPELDRWDQSSVTNLRNMAKFKRKFSLLEMA